MEGVTQVQGASVLEQHYISRGVASIHRENEEAPRRSTRSVAPATRSSTLDSEALASIAVRQLFASASQTMKE
ncbi:hypothetical protein EYF80_038906 [Liparis tanakae]|uniref:Uncharacterized protein n=1 Tax=Liparis tanakae TaxID=230148 RepID=A0A4Z2GDY3_9TELE|nr:hypothetical protein EYF80_038906 [Liparis tanakae]